MSMTEQPMNGEVEEIATPEPSMEAEEETVKEPENPEDADAPPEEKPAEVPEEQKAVENSLASGIEPPGARLDMIELARMQHVIAIHKHAFVETASQSLQKALHNEIASDASGGLNEGTAEITFYFDDKGGIGEVWGSSGSEKLKAALMRVDWLSLPSPADFRFRMNGLRVSVKIEKGEPALEFFVL